MLAPLGLKRNPRPNRPPHRARRQTRRGGSFCLPGPVTARTSEASRLVNREARTHLRFFPSSRFMAETHVPPTARASVTEAPREEPPTPSCLWENSHTAPRHTAPRHRLPESIRGHGDFGSAGDSQRGAPGAVQGRLGDCRARDGPHAPDARTRAHSGLCRSGGVSGSGEPPPRCPGCFSPGLLPTSFPFPPALLSDKIIIVLVSVPGPAWFRAWS